VVWGVSVNGADVRVTGSVYNREIPCLDNGTGAGYDTVLALTALPDQLYTVWAPMLDLISWSPSDRLVGYFDVATTPDTTPEFAGAAYLISDSLGCWRALPWSESPGRWLALAQPPPLTSGWQGNAFLVGQLVAGSPPSCGDARSINASTLAVYANLF
jgi:hypothetical protein